MRHFASRFPSPMAALYLSDARVNRALVGFVQKPRGIEVFRA